MAKAVKSAFKFVGKIVFGVAGFAIKPVLRALTPKAPEVDTSAVVNFRADPNAGIPYVIGRTGTAGVYTYATVGEAKNRNILFHTVLSGGGPIDSFVSFSMGGVNVVFDGADTPESGPYRHLVWQRRQLGATPSTYLQPPNTTDAAVLSEWDSTHKTSGYATAWYVLGADQNAYSGGVPDPLWVLKGVKVYDWRLDSTYPGGSGPQRSNDPSTWAWSENPALHAVTWLLGRYQNGKRVLGLGAAMTQIVIAKYAEWANVCDANGWKVGGVVYSTDTKWQVLKAICQAGGAYPVPLGAKVSVIFNAPRVSIATLTGADMDGEPSIVGAQLRRDRFNSAIPRFRSEANGWQIVPAAKLVVSDFVTQDGQPRSKELEWPLVQDVDQATQLAAYAICNSRELGPLDFPVIPYWMGLEPGDCITVNEPEYGLTNQKLIIVERNRSLGSFERSITCVTETDSKHAFCLGQTGTAPPLPSLGAVDTLPAPPDPGSWTSTGGTLVGPDGSLPVLVLTGSVNDPNVIAIIIEYRLVGSSGDWTSIEKPPNTTRVEITGLQPGSSYDVRIRYRYARNTEDPTTNLILPPSVVGGVSASTLGDLTPDGVEDAIAAAQAAAVDALTALFDPTSGALVEIDALQSGQATHTSQIAVLQTADVVLAGRVDTTEARLSSRPNICPNGGGENGITGLSATNGTLSAVDNVWGRSIAIIPSIGSTFCTINFPTFLAEAGESYVNAADLLHVVSDGLGSSYVDIQFTDAGGTILPGGDGPQNPRTGSFDFSTGDATRSIVAVAATAPAGTVKAYARAVFLFTSPATATALGVRQMKAERGALPYTPYTSEAQQVSTVARVTNTEITSASNTAAIAATETRVGISMQQGAYINANARLGAYTITPGLPDGWPSLWGAGPSSRFSRQPGEGANYCARAIVTAGEDLGFYQSVDLTDGKYLLTLEGRCNSGDWSGAGLTIGGVYSINCLTDADAAGVTGSGGTGVRRWSKIVTITAGTYNFHAMYGYAPFGAITAKNLDLYSIGIQSMSAEGMAALNAQADASTALTAYATLNSAFASFSSTATARLDDLDATVSTQATAIAGVRGRTATYAVKVAAAGADPAYFSMSSDSSAPGGVDSFIALAAKEIALFNTAGGGTLVKALSLTSGNAYFPGTIWVGPTENLIADGPNKRWLVKDDLGNIVCEMGQLL